MKRLLVLMAILASLTACTTTRAQIAVSDSVEYKLKNVNSGLVLGVSGMSETAGAAAVQWADNGTADHLWHFMPMGSNQYNIENMYTHQVLGVTNASTANGAAIVQWADNGTSDHLWTVTQAADGNYMIKNVNSGRYLEVANAGTLDTALIDQWSSTSCTCQEWQLVNTGTSPYPAPRAVTGSGIYVHDPYMLKDTSGTYWLYGTHQTLASSTDLTTFTPYTGCTSTQKGGYTNCPIIGPDFSSWTGLQTPKSWNSGANTDIWAPSLMYQSGTYYQYYSIPYEPSTGAEAVIGVATSSNPYGPWTDKGFVTRSWTSTTTSPPSGFWATTDNAIDPAPFTDTSGNWWMVWGSWTDGIHLVQLNPSTGLQSSSNTTVYTIAQRGSPSAGEEGPFIYSWNGYYYYFAPINVCCNGVNSTYRIIVGRSTSVTGPYVDRGGIALTSGGGSILLSSHGNINGPGGMSVFTDTVSGTQTPTLVYHYYDGNNSGTPTLGINRLGFDSSGWPYVE